MRLPSGKHSCIVVLVPWWFPSKMEVTRKDVVKFKNALRWRRIEITSGAREEIRRLRDENKSFRKYSITRIALLIALAKIPSEGVIEMKKDSRIESIVSPLEGPEDWRDFIKREGLVEEIRDVTDDKEYEPWRKLVEAAAKKGVNGRAVLRRPNGESAIVTFGHPMVVAPAYEEIKDEELELVKNETNISDDELVQLLEIAFKLRE